ncbi:N-acetylmuramidase domain-containing protein [Aquamicrobium segne]|uniref:N-acetylmuramidase domain-containing protein n=1 Tax=Aquamicrobium segne TaxID=469547 RepID=A0ABW0GZ46_9HYPH
MFSDAIIKQTHAEAKRAGIEPAALLAVMEVESGGRLFAVVNGRNEPLIRFEGHYFDRRLSGVKQMQARQQGLSSPVAGAIANPSTQAKRWNLLEKAARIDANAAYESTSWGVGQVMGAHWSWLGFANVQGLVGEARSGAAGQIRLMVRYINKAGLVKLLNTHDWQGFARSYNGPAFAKNSYDRKLAAAYARHVSGTQLPPSASATILLRRGAKGEAVMDLQRQLNRQGFALQIDGLFGPATQKAIRSFQKTHGLVIDGIVGPQTRAALNKATAPALSRWWDAIKSLFW